MTVVFLARVQRGLYPIRMVGRIRIFLTLQTNADVLGVGDTMLAGNILVRTYALEVTTIYLYTWLVGKHLHQDTCLGRVETCTYLSIVALAILECIQAEIMVVTCGILNLVEF